MSSAAHVRKILIVAFILAVVCVGGVASYFTFLKPSEPYITKPISSVTTSSVTQTSVTQASASSQTIASSKTTTTELPSQWITIGQPESIDYYLSLLESNGTAPYVQLASELRKLPDLQNATAVATITYLALNATNSEVKEAFQLILRGGTPDRRDFGYAVPVYNTELEVLYWLACGAEFKKNDTLALALAMTHGIWVTMGDKNVRAAVKKDVSDSLVFLRETDELEAMRWYSSLEGYPLEAKIALAWRGDQSSVRSYHDPRDYLGLPMDMTAYRWATIDIPTLVEMRNLTTQKGWVQKTIPATVTRLETLFFTSSNRLWIYPQSDGYITIEGQTIANHNFNSADLEFQYYLQNGKGIGWCSDEMGFLTALLKSWGISTTSLWGDRMVQGEKMSGHTHVIFFNPAELKWKADPAQLQIDVNNDFNSFYISKPKIALSGFAISNRGTGLRYIFSKFVISESDVKHVQAMFLQGVETSQMKQWLLYTGA